MFNVQIELSVLNDKKNVKNEYNKHYRIAGMDVILRILREFP